MSVIFLIFFYAYFFTWQSDKQKRKISNPIATWYIFYFYFFFAQIDGIFLY